MVKAIAYTFLKAISDLFKERNLWPTGGGKYVGIGKLWTARSRLYRGRILQVNTSKWPHDQRDKELIKKLIKTLIS